jgi:type II secretory pathway pseudopilin PulG
MQPLSPIRSRSAASEEGFLLIAMIFAVAVLLIFLAVAAPSVAKDLQREREIEMVHRGNQYVRAIRVFYNLNHAYPTSIDQLVKSNNRRYLRQQYADPMTGKPDWRIIHLGENQTKVTGFFGEPLDTLGASAGINGASAPGSSPMPAPTPGSATGSTSSNGSPASNDATTFNGGGGPIIGVSSLSTKTSIITIHGKNTYNTWEFLYDPLIEKLYNSSQLTGGGGGLNGGLGSVGSSLNGNGSSNNGGANNGNSNSSFGFGSSNGSSGSGSRSGSGFGVGPSSPDGSH